jgi:drug/metabolite transporter (DMT)-like permease
MSVVYALLLGVLSTVLLHLSKAMERQGIEIFDQLRAKIKKNKESDDESDKLLSEKPSENNSNNSNNSNSEANESAESNKLEEPDVKKPVIYIVGLIINNLTPLWMMLANLYAPPSYFTSMFGLGLIVLMLYSSKILKEKIEKIEYIGAFILIVGTIILGVESILQPELDMSQIDTSKVWLIVGIWLIVGVLLVIFAYKSGNTLIIGVIFGLFAGGSGCFDPIFKSMGQTLGGTVGLFPSTGMGWFIFICSFAFGICAFGFTQWGFAKKAKASTLVPAYNSLYVIFPIIVLYIALPGFQITYVTIIGLILVVIGIVLMQAFKKGEKSGH